jgi:cellulase/cellobiase CelA1
MVVMVAQQYCYITSPTPVAVWQDGGSSPGNHENTRDIPLLLKCDVIAAAELLFTGRLPSNAPLRNPTKGWYVIIFIIIIIISGNGGGGSSSSSSNSSSSADHSDRAV